eukprot:m.58828 g.58828  ORF g.58828 m.58828 type:complete len:442 (-) comp11201_c0_seq4:246-1571(-)
MLAFKMQIVFFFLLQVTQATREPNDCTIDAFGAVPDNHTDNSAAFRHALGNSSGCDMVIVPPGVWLTGPFNITSNKILVVEKNATISGIRDPTRYPLVVQQPLDEAYRNPVFNNTQYQALVSAYSAHNFSIIGGGTIDGQGWDWWYNFTFNSTNTWLHQRPKLAEFVDCSNIFISNITLMNSPFWTLHPTFCENVTITHIQTLAPRDHGNTDGIDPDSCKNVYVADSLVDVGDDGISVKSGLHWLTKKKVAAENYLFERVTILYRNFAIGSDVSGDVRNITFRDSTIGDDKGSSPWAIKVKTDSQEGGVVDGVYFKNVRIGNITYCGSSKFVFTPPHSKKDFCKPGYPGATMIDLNVGYVGAITNPGIARNIVFENIYGIGPTGVSMMAHGGPTPSEHTVNLTLKNISLTTGGPWLCNNIDNITIENVRHWPAGSTCKSSN